MSCSGSILVDAPRRFGSREPAPEMVSALASSVPLAPYHRLRAWLALVRLIEHLRPWRSGERMEPHEARHAVGGRAVEGGLDSFSGGHDVVCAENHQPRRTTVARVLLRTITCGVAPLLTWLLCAQCSCADCACHESYSGCPVPLCILRRRDRPYLRQSAP